MKRPVLSVLAVTLVGGLLWYFLRTTPVVETETEEAPVAAAPKPNNHGLPSSFGLSSEEPEAEEEAPDGAFGNEAVLVFNDAEAYAKFLRNLPKGVKVLAANGKLKAVRLSLDKKARAALGKEFKDAEFGGNFPVFAPTPPQTGDPTVSGSPFNRSVMADIGITGSRAGFGKGVTVAILDTAISEHPMLKTLAGTLDLVNDKAGASDFSGHGTAVASLIAGQGKTLAGPAPEASLLSVRVLDENGQGNTFTVAEGIVAAVDAGAKVINLSLAGSGDSPALEAAVKYALANGVALVAAAGNDGLGAISYPAAYAGVISVGATDSTGSHAPFSNTGEGLSLSAPGVGIPAAFGEGEAISFTGTSAAAPLVSGAIATILSQNPNMTPAEAGQLLVAYANDNGAAGNDAFFGAGLIDLDRVTRRSDPTLADAAVSSVLFSEAPSNLGEIYTVNVENRGNLTLGNVFIEVQTPKGPSVYRLDSIPAGETVSQVLPAQAAVAAGQTALKVVVKIAGATDARPANDTQIVVEPQPVETDFKVP